MDEIIVMLRDTTNINWGTSFFQLLFLLSVLFILFKEQDDMKKILLGYYPILILIVIYNPIVSIVCYYIFGTRKLAVYYCRLFLTIPIYFIIAYVLTKIIKKCDMRKRVCAFFLMAIFIIIGGHTFYQDTWYSKADNFEKVPQEVIEVCEILQIADEDKKVMMPPELLSYVRQIDASIKMPYGFPSQESAIAKNLVSDHPDMGYILLYGSKLNCNYMVCARNEAFTTFIEKSDCEILGMTKNYYVIRINYKYQSEYTITQYSSVTGNQSLIYTITDWQGHLIIVDGGWEQDADQMLQIIKENGGKVDAWIITHPHSDHVGCFNVIYESGLVSIDTIYTIPMNYAMYKNRAQYWDGFEFYEEFRNLTTDAENVVYLHEGDTFEVMGLDFEVLHSFNREQMKNVGDVCNDGGLIFRVDAKNNSMLFLGDVGVGQSQNVLNDHSDRLKVDYVQMGHHGNGGMSEEVYQVIRPEVAFFDAPQWLMEDETRDAPRKRELMESLGAEIYSYQTAPNYVILE